MKPSLGRVFTQYSLPFLAVIAGHVFLLWTLVKGLAMAAAKPPEVVVMASIISAPVVAPETKAEPEPPKPQPKPRIEKTKPQPLAIKPRKVVEKPSDRVVAPAPEKVASAPVESQQESTTKVASGAPTQGEASHEETKPTLVEAGNTPKVLYPALSRRMGEEGTAIIRLQVGVDGQVLDVRVEKSSGYPRLDAAALEGVRKARYKAGTRGGVPVVMWARQPIRFNLTQAD